MESSDTKVCVHCTDADAIKSDQMEACDVTTPFLLEHLVVPIISFIPTSYSHQFEAFDPGTEAGIWDNCISVSLGASSDGHRGTNSEHIVVSIVVYQLT